MVGWLEQGIGALVTISVQWVHVIDYILHLLQLIVRLSILLFLDQDLLVLFLLESVFIFFPDSHVSSSSRL